MMRSTAYFLEIFTTCPGRSHCCDESRNLMHDMDLCIDIDKIDKIPIEAQNDHGIRKRKTYNSLLTYFMTSGMPF